MIRQGLTRAAKQAFLRGVHQSGDTYKIALFTAAANLDPDATETYTPVGETKGEGYEAGGLVLSGIQYSAQDSCMGWASGPRWPLSSIRARGALIYNASKNNAALVVLDFGEDKVSSVGPWFMDDGALADLIQLV